MHIRVFAFMVIVTCAALPTLANEPMHDHGGQLFHRFQLEADTGRERENTISTWDFKGWIGGDINRLALKSEGQKSGSHLEHAEFQAMYSRNISGFWDMQVGLRHDTQPEATSYITVGFEGLAPYFFDTEAHIFVSDKGDVSARIRQENDLLITQELIIQPYLEFNLYAQNVPEQAGGGGLAKGEIGLQTRYEITRKFAPYVDVHYERSFGETASIARRNSEKIDNFIVSAGVRLVF